MAQVSSSLTPSDIVVFGGNGDLAMRKIMPALYYRIRDGQLPEESRIIGAARKDYDREAYVAAVHEALVTYVPKQDFDESVWARFAACLDYQPTNAKEAESYKQLKKKLAASPREARVFYLAVPAEIYGTICEHLKGQGLITPTTRVVVEKPLGYDLASFKAIDNTILSCFDETQIYRIDHYLGKETVQNLMVLRFANNLLARVWNGDAIDHVQITVAESIGVGAREGYYDHSGALRDMVQNHLLQLLCLVAMEPPAQVTPDAVRDEKLKILRALRPVDRSNVAQETVRGQYGAGTSEAKPVEGYRTDVNNPDSITESFVALKVHVDNWRWSGVPFYLRTGKRMTQRYSEIVIQFRPVPHHIFPGSGPEPETNKLIIRIQPDEGVKLEMVSKAPGPGGYRLKPVYLDLSMADAFKERYPDAYERLLMDVVRGNPTLFMRSDEVEAAWIWIESILDSWKETDLPIQTYAAGTMGPNASVAMLARDGRKWHEELV
jgi:glucose-6-phosphate 1-dehydrogenase